MTRTLYTDTNVKINGSGLIAQSFSLNKSMPHEQIDVYGSNFFNQVQGEPSTANCEISCYPVSGTFGNLLQQLTSHTRSSDPTRETVLSNFGGLDHALLTSLRMDAAIGSVPIANLSFIGAIATGRLVSSSVSTSINTVQTTESISINGGDICAQRCSFDWAIPVASIPKYDESLSYPTGFFGEPVGVTNVSLEGITEPLSMVDSINFGGFSVAFTDIKVISSGVNQAIGTIGATYSVNYTCSANNVNFT